MIQFGLHRRKRSTTLHPRIICSRSVCICWNLFSLLLFVIMMLMNYCWDWKGKLSEFLLICIYIYWKSNIFTFSRNVVYFVVNFIFVAAVFDNIFVLWIIGMILLSLCKHFTQSFRSFNKKKQSLPKLKSWKGKNKGKKSRCKNYYNNRFHSSRAPGSYELNRFNRK